jgi:hypothetical protein
MKIKLLILLVLFGLNATSQQANWFIETESCTDTTIYYNTTTSHIFYWQCPSGITEITVISVGAGGGGGYTTGERGGGGGGGGAYVKAFVTTVPGDTYKIDLGLGGTGQTSGSTNGDATYLYDDDDNILIKAVGGKKGDFAGDGDNGHGGAGGLNTDNSYVGTLIASTSGGRGGNGYNAANTSHCAGAGGEYGTSSGTGDAGTDDFMCTAGTGSNGTAGIGGGGGMSTNSTSYAGGNGGDGFLSITYCK